MYKIIITRDLKVIQRRGKTWRYADKEESENQPINYLHLISLLGVESKRVHNLLSTEDRHNVTQWCGSKGDLAVLWLDFTDAYESIPQKRLKVGLERHYILRRWGKRNILDLQVFADELTSDWHQLEMGIITRYTISETLFTINMLVKAAQPECRGPLSKTELTTTQNSLYGTSQ